MYFSSIFPLFYSKLFHWLLDRWLVVLINEVHSKVDFTFWVLRYFSKLLHMFCLPRHHYQCNCTSFHLSSLCLITCGRHCFYDGLRERLHPFMAHCASGDEACAHAPTFSANEIYKAEPCGYSRLYDSDKKVTICMFLVLCIHRVLLRNLLRVVFLSVASGPRL